ncbi:protein shifted isoform X2 [Condylostylus longicornis]|uniref:protein shifted isoform X2 n=1 Tax=Condylostylus longicornis TaxID=2530218 RepID=UPI00244DCE85|nr:protein shifted isoform X2 [Condylostylus longicornis]
MKRFFEEILSSIVIFIIFFILTKPIHSKRNNHNKDLDNGEQGLSLWINEQQLKVLSGYAFRVYAIHNSCVNIDLRDPNFSQKLPTIPSEVNSVNFTWTSGGKKYNYNFDRLESSDKNILKPPTVSIKTKGRIPKRQKDFSIFLPCTGNLSGVAAFGIGLLIQDRHGKQLPGTPLRLTFNKECAHRGPDPECDKKCNSNGHCNPEKVCQCKNGYMGQYCQTALCYPQCMNGGSCVAPNVCSCPPGYQGKHCEGGICANKCLNGGKCIQKDKCKCSKGYFGPRCEMSRCFIPCKNGGKCIGTNKCDCPLGLRGDHCEIGQRDKSYRCRKPCVHGECLTNRTCKCQEGFTGRFCNQRKWKPRIDESGS